MTSSEYSNLKDQVVLGASTSERHSDILSSLKELFRDDINSVRRLEQISSVGQLLKVLEIRDVLAEDNVGPLKQIARKLSNGVDLLRKISEYEEFHMPREFIPYYASKNTSKQETLPESPISSNPLAGTLSIRKRQRIFDTITEEIGTFWRDLARSLKVREGTIIQIDSQNATIPSKVTKLLELYESRADPQRWFFVLCDALERARRKDIAKSLQEIMAMNI